MNKELMLAIILVSMFPGIVASAHGISGFLVANASESNVSSNASIAQAVNIVPGAYTIPSSGYASFYALATVLILIALAYLLNEYRKEDKKISSKSKVVKKIHAVNKSEKKASEQNLISSLKILTQKIKFAKMNNDKAEKYMVFIVGAVAIAGILVLILR